MAACRCGLRCSTRKKKLV